MNHAWLDNRSKRTYQMLGIIGVALLVVALLGGCPKPETSGPTPPIVPPTPTRTFTIGLNQFMSHPLLDKVAKGLKDELAEAGIASDKGSTIIEKNANGEQSVAIQINKQFVQTDVDLIVALGTPAAQSACKETTTIPIVFGAITDPVQAGIADSVDAPGGNKTGTSDRWPFEKQVELIKQIVPSAEVAGIVLNPAEANTEASMSYTRPALEKAGLQPLEVPVSSTSEVYNAAKSLVGRCDVILITGDNTSIGAIGAIVKVCRQSKLPLIGGTEDLVEQGSIATYAADYYQIGRTTGRMAVEILRDGKDPGTMPVAVAEEAELVVNEEAASVLGAVIPEELVKAARKQ